MPSKAELVCVPPHDVKKVWGHVRPYILKAARRGSGDIFAIESEVLNGRYLLWLAWDGQIIIAAAVTSLGIINNEKVCTIVACGGEGWSRFGHLIEGLEQHAKDEGCKSVRINGRTGWQYLLSGYRTKLVVLEKAL